MPLTSQALELYAGTSETFALQLTRLDNTTPLDLTAATDILVLFKNAYSDDDSAAVITRSLVGTTVAITDAVHGAITVTLVPADTNNISSNTTLFWHAKVFYSSTSQRIGAAGTLLIDRNAVRKIS